MLASQQTLSLSAYSSLYDLIIPKDNILRKINDLVDFSFVHDELVNKYSLINGRTAESPIKLFKYLLLKNIYDISDAAVVERSRFDMSFKYFLDMAPEDDVINPSTLTKFRKLRLSDTDLLKLLISETVRLAISKEIIKSKAIIVDATHTASRSNPFSATAALKMRSGQLRKALYGVDDNIKTKLPLKNEDNNLEPELLYSKTLITFLKQHAGFLAYPKVQEKFEMLEETLEDIQERYTLSKDKDARIGHKSEDTNFFGYKTHIAMSKERIITSAVVTSGEKGDGPLLQTLIQDSIDNGMTVETVIGDAAYSGKDNLEYAKDNNIKVVAKLNSIISHGARKEQDKFDYNKDADMYVCPQGHLALRKAKQGKKNTAENQVITYYFDTGKCKICPLREGCYKPEAKTKTYSVSIKSQTHLKQLEFQNSEEFKQEAKHRYKIEAKNAELKNVHGYNRADSYGLSCMQMQGAITIFTVNIKRILKIADK